MVKSQDGMRLQFMVKSQDGIRLQFMVKSQDGIRLQGPKFPRDCSFWEVLR
jgi:hypothetical protein